MSQRAVQSVFFWPADMATPFRAVYGRIERSNNYSKDFHQIAAGPARAMERAFGLDERGQTRITWMWPGGERGENSQFKPASEGDARSRANWPFGESPDPWRLNPEPSADTLQSIQGTPGRHGAPAMPASQEAVAAAQFQRVVAAGERPWYVAVHLFGDGPILHTRAYLENPKPGHEFASWEKLPAQVQRAMAALRRGREATGYVEFEETAPMSTGQIVKEILEAFKDNPNVLLVGPPGTGKTVAMEQVRALYEGRPVDTVTFDPDRNHEAFEVVESGFDGDQKARSIVFHPSYAYEHFVMGLLPDLDDTTNQVVVKPHVGPLLELAHFAREPQRRALLILDEFNRAPASAVFGDTIALLDADKRAKPGDPESGAKIATPYAHLRPQTADGDVLGQETTIPSSLFILGAMNSADRSVAPLDAALRRRFAIIRVDPDYEVLRDHLLDGVDTSAFDIHDPTSWTEAEHIKFLTIAILRTLNQRIEMIEGRDFLLGPSVFWNVSGETRQEALRSLAVAIDNRVIGTLALTFLDNDDALAAVLNVDGQTTTSKRAAEWVDPDSSIASVAMRRLRPTRFQDLDESDLVSALTSLL